MVRKGNAPMGLTFQHSILLSSPLNDEMNYLFWVVASKNLIKTLASRNREKFDDSLY